MQGRSLTTDLGHIKGNRETQAMIASISANASQILKAIGSGLSMVHSLLLLAPRCNTPLR
jgi:hypothetical protein